MTIEELFEKNTELVQYWKHNNLTPSSFYCRKCGKLMLDVDDISDVGYNPMRKDNCSLYRGKKSRAYVESEKNRWLTRGRTLSGKTYFRHLCWDCFFSVLPEIEDIPKRARKSSWYKDVLDGILRPPATCSSPSKYFKIIFDMTDEELEREHLKFDTASLESFIRRHGEKNGTLKYEEYKKRQAYTCSKEYMMGEKGMTEDEWNEFNANRSCTKENFIKRYGKDLGTKKWKSYCELESYVGCKLEYFIEKHGETEGRERYLTLNKSKSLTLENFIRKYGDDIGKIKYEELTSKQFSKVSKDMFDIITKELGPLGLNAKYGDNELAINIFFDDSTCHVCYPDYILNTKIIEFNGDYWHANPKIYSPNYTIPYDLISTKYNGNTAKDIWEYDNKKKSKLEELGYDVKVVWESDYRSDPQKTINECLEFLREK